MDAINFNLVAMYPESVLSCRITGALPSLSALELCHNLTLFGNQLQGQLELPLNSSLDTILIQSNRLSCEMVADPHQKASSNVLALPGNTFTGGSTRAAVM